MHLVGWSLPCEKSTKSLRYIGRYIGSQMHALSRVELALREEHKVLEVDVAARLALGDAHRLLELRLQEGARAEARVPIYGRWTDACT